MLSNLSRTTFSILLTIAVLVLPFHLDVKNASAAAVAHLPARNVNGVSFSYPKTGQDPIDATNTANVVTIVSGGVQSFTFTTNLKGEIGTGCYDLVLEAHTDPFTTADTSAQVGGISNAFCGGVKLGPVSLTWDTGANAQWNNGTRKPSNGLYYMRVYLKGPGPAGGGMWGTAYDQYVLIRIIGRIDCTDFTSTNVVLFENTDCQPGKLGIATQQYLSNLTTNTFDSGTNANDAASAIYIPSNASAMVYQHSEKNGEKKCLIQTAPNLGSLTFDNGLNINNEISSIQTFNNPSCTSPPNVDCSNVVPATTPGVILYKDSTCSDQSPQSFPKVSYGAVLQSGMNDQTSSVFVGSGYSIRVFKDINATGLSKCLKNSYWNFTLDKYDTDASGNSIASPTEGMNDTVSSVEVYKNASCTRLPMLFQDANYNNNGQNTGAGATTIADNICLTTSTSVPKFDTGASLIELSSIHVRPSQSVGIFSNSDWAGTGTTYTSDAAGIGSLNDLVYSIKVSGGVTTCQSPMHCNVAAPTPVENPTSIWFDELSDLTSRSATLGSYHDTKSGDTHSWDWPTDIPAVSGASAHQSRADTANHEHYFTVDSAHAFPALQAGDSIYTYICIDKDNPPDEVMMQFMDSSGSVEHRAYWGATKSGSDLIPVGTIDTPSKRYMGSIPAEKVGSWYKLSIPVEQVGLLGQSVRGVDFKLQGGRAAWDKMGAESSAFFLDLKDFETSIPQNSAILLEAKTRNPDLIKGYKVQFFYRIPGSAANNFIGDGVYQEGSGQFQKDHPHKSSWYKWTTNSFSLLPVASGYKILAVATTTTGSTVSSPTIDFNVVEKITDNTTLPPLQKTVPMVYPVIPPPPATIDTLHMIGGTISNSSGQKAEKVTVTAVRAGYPTLTTKTLFDGTYVFVGLTAGTYLITPQNSTEFSYTLGGVNVTIGSQYLVKKDFTGTIIQAQLN